MIIRKTGVCLGVAFSLLAFTAAAKADCTDEIADLKAAADKLRCGYGDFAGGSIYNWMNDPIWQKEAGKGKGKKPDAEPAEPGDGCEVHWNMARKLYEEPVVKETNRKGNGPATKSDSRGAARALEDGKYQEAVDLLIGLQASIASSVTTPEDEFTNVFDPETGASGNAEYWATKLSDFAGTIAGRIHPDTQSCD